MRILLIDDHPLILAANEELVRAILPQAEFCTCTSFAQVKEKRGERFDVIFSDLCLPDVSPQEMTAYLESTFREAKMVFFSAFAEASEVVENAKQRGHLFVSKSGTYKGIVAALTTYLGIGSKLDLEPTNEFRSTIQIAGFKPLTLKQAAAMDLIVQGKTNKEIAKELGVSPDTVRAHVKEAYARLNNATNRAQAVSSFLQAKKVSESLKID